MAPFRNLWRVPDIFTPPHLIVRDDLPITSSLNGLVSLCAEPCLANYVDSFWVPQPCSNTSGLSCLCDNYSTSGYTLGEIAYECIAASCPEAAPSQSSQALHICASQTGAVPATHSSLSVVVSVVLTSTTSVSSTPIPSVSRLSLSLPPLIPSIATATSSPSTTFATSRSAIPTATSANNATVPHSGSLTSGQSIGITIGAFGAFGLAMALFFCCCCWRRKKTKEKKNKDQEVKRRHSYDFRCATTPTSPRHASSSDIIPDPLSRRLNLFNTRSRQISADDKLHIYNLRVHRGGVVDKYNGPAATEAQIVTQTPSIAMSGGNGHDSRTRPSNAKKRVSRGRWSRALSTISRGTVFEEDDVPAAPAAKTYSAKGGALSKAGEGSGKKAKLKLNIPPIRIVQETEAVDMANTRGLKSATLHPHDPRRQETASQASAPFPSAGSGISYIPSYYMSNDSRTPRIPAKSPARKEHVHDHAQPPSRTWPLRNDARRSRMSMSSATTFESVDPDEVTPPDEKEKQLEGRVSSPGSDVRYPKIPRSAAQAVPRSPVLKVSVAAKDPSGRKEWSRRRQEAHPSQGRQTAAPYEEPVYWF